MIQAILESVQPDLDLLLGEISRHITDDMLAEIASADYGLDQELHFAKLRHLRNTGAFIEPMHFYPCEVLELVRHSRLSYLAKRKGAVDLGHNWILSFASAALIRAREEPWKYSGDSAFPSFNLICLIGGIDGLDIDLIPMALSLISWIMLHSDLDGEDEQTIYCGVGFLWLSLHLKILPPDESLIEIAEWIVRREAEIHQSRSWAFDRWLLGIGHDPPPSPWELLGARMCELNLSNHQKELQNWVQLIGKELAGEGQTTS